jgi:manganese transport protein
MDPGNWATDLSGGASFGYTLLSIILNSNFMAIFLQYLSLKLGTMTNQDLAQACQDVYPKWVVYCLWIIMEIAIASTDLAESLVQLLH